MKRTLFHIAPLAALVFVAAVVLTACGGVKAFLGGAEPPAVPLATTAELPRVSVAAAALQVAGFRQTLHDQRALGLLTADEFQDGRALADQAEAAVLEAQRAVHALDPNAKTRIDFAAGLATALAVWAVNHEGGKP